MRIPSPAPEPVLSAAMSVVSATLAPRRMAVMINGSVAGARTLTKMSRFFAPRDTCGLDQRFVHVDDALIDGYAHCEEAGYRNDRDLSRTSDAGGHNYQRNVSQGRDVADELYPGVQDIANRQVPGHEDGDRQSYYEPEGEARSDTYETAGEVCQRTRRSLSCGQDPLLWPAQTGTHVPVLSPMLIRYQTTRATSREITPHAQAGILLAQEFLLFPQLRSPLSENNTT